MSLGRFKTILLVLVMVLASLPALAAQPSDFDQHWAKPQISDWLQKGYISGYADGSFKPEQSITRAEFIVLVNKVFGYTNKAAADYPDVASGAWYSDAIARAKAAGYISGYSDGRIKPNDPISRQEAAVIIMRNKDLQSNSSAADKFSDVSEIAGWGKGAIGAVVSAGLMCGYPDGSFKASSPIKRGEAVAALSKLAVAAGPTEPQAMIYDRPGTYGGAETQTLTGNVLIKAPDVILQNTIIQGDLTIDKSVGEGNLILRKVAVKGNTYVNGGGVNSVYFIDTQTGKTYVRKDNGPVRIVASGSSEITQLITQSSVKVEAQDLKGTGFAGIVVEKKAEGKIEVSLSGVKVESFTINSGDILVKADKATEIANLTIKAPGATIATENGATIAKLVADAQVAITGKGTVQNASINANGVSLETPAQSQTMAPGVSAPAAASPGGTGGGAATSDSGSSRINATPITAVQTSVKQGSVEFGFTFKSKETSLNYVQATAGPYYLDPAASTMILATAQNTISNPVSFSDLGVDPQDGKLVFSDYDALAAKFPVLATGPQLPVRAKFHLVSKTKVGSKTVNVPWTYDSEWLDFNTQDSQVFSLYADKMALQVKDGNGQPLNEAALASISDSLNLGTDGLFGSTISWQSSNEAVLAPNGSVHRPASGAGDCSVTLTATIKLGNLSTTKTFALTVKKAGLPVFLTGYPKIVNETETSFDLLIKMDQAGKMYYLLLTDGAQAPSVAEVVYADHTLNFAADTEARTMLSSLAPKTTYDLYMVFQNTYNPPATSSSAVKMDVGTADHTPPAFAANYPKTANITANGFDLLLKMDEAGKVYYLLKADGAAAPSIAEIKAANNAVDVPAANSEISATVSGLNESASYDLYVLAQDDQANPNIQASPAKLDVQTRDTTPPVFASGYPQVSKLDEPSFDLLVKLNEPGKVFYKIQANDSVAPSVNDVVANNQSITAGSANTEVSASIGALTGGTDYDVYLVAQDSQNPPNRQVSLTKLDVKTPMGFSSGYPKTANAGNTSFDILVKAAQAGTVYYKLVPGAAAAPTAAEVIADNKKKSIAANTEESITVNGLPTGTTYDVYLVLDDSSAVPVHKNSPAKLCVATTGPDSSPPVFAAGYPKFNGNITYGGFDRYYHYLIKMNEAGKVYFMDSAQRYPEFGIPYWSRDEVISNKTMVIDIPSTGEVEFWFKPAGGSRDLYFVAVDDEATPNQQSVPRIIRANFAANAANCYNTIIQEGY